MTKSSTSGTLSSAVYTLQQSNPRHVSPCCLVKVQRGCVGDACASGVDNSRQGGSWDPPETWARDPEIMRSEAPKQQAEWLKSDTLSLPWASSLLLSLVSGSEVC